MQREDFFLGEEESNNYWESDYYIQEEEEDFKPLVEISAFNSSTKTFAPHPPELSDGCVRCKLWSQDNCTKWEPCVYCNLTLPCQDEGEVCSDNVCVDPFYGGEPVA